MIRVARLTPDEIRTLRSLDARIRVAEAGHPGWTPDQCVLHIIAYGEFLEHLHDLYDLDEDEVYSFDSARGFIFEGLE